MDKQWTNSGTAMRDSDSLTDIGVLLLPACASMRVLLCALQASPRGKSGKSAAAAAAAGDPSRAAADARKRKRSHQAAGGQQKGPLAAARAVGAARAPDSGNTEYQDAREEAGQSEESKELPAAAAAAASRQRGQGQGHGQSPRQRLHKQQQQRQLPQRVRGGAAAAAAAAAAGGGDDSSVDDPESDDAFDYDGGSDDEGNAGGQQQRRRQGRPSSKQPQQHKRPAGAASGGRARGGGAAFDPDFDEAGDVHGGHKKRRKVRRWTAEEEALLIQLVAQEGEGQWALIHQLGGDGFDSRTQVGWGWTDTTVLHALQGCCVVRMWHGQACGVLSVTASDEIELLLGVAAS